MTDAQQALMELGVPCQCAKGPPAFSGPGIKGFSTSPDCSCEGSGIRYPLRLPCPDGECQRNKGKVLWTFEGQDTQFIDHAECGGSTFLFNPDPDALTDAIRAKGWKLEFIAEPECEGDHVVIRGWNGEEFSVIGVADYDEDGLRGQAAIQEAVARAVRNEDGK